MPVNTNTRVGAQKWPWPHPHLHPHPRPRLSRSVWLRVKLDPSHLTFGGSDERQESQGHSCEGVSTATHAPLRLLPNKERNSIAAY